MSYYLSHPFDTKEMMRQWELRIEVEYDLEIINPFYDISRDDIRAIDQGLMGRYEGLDPEVIVHRDLNAIAQSDGVIAYIDGSVSYGTIMEIVYAYQLNKTVNLIITNGHEQHPWLVFHSGPIYTSLEAFEYTL